LPSKHYFSGLTLAHAAYFQDRAGGDLCANNPRAAATVTLIAVAIVAARAATFSPSPPSPVTEVVTPSRVAAAGSSAPVTPARIVDAVAPGGSCKDQTWPYIDTHCLKRIDGHAPNPAETAAVNSIVTPAEPQGAAMTAVPPQSAAPAPAAQTMPPSPSASQPQIALTAEAAEEVGLAARAELPGMHADKQRGRHAGHFSRHWRSRPFFAFF